MTPETAPTPSEDTRRAHARELWWLISIFFLLLFVAFTSVCWDQVVRILRSDPAASGTLVERVLSSVLFGLAPIGIALLALHLRRRRESWLPGLVGFLERHEATVEELPARHLWWLIALAAGGGLFAELAMIRVHSSFIQLFAYFKNFSLLSCFLGLGVGYARSGRSSLWTPLFVPLVAGQVLSLDLLSRLSTQAFLQNPIPEELALGFNNLAHQLAGSLAAFVFLALIFALNALCFVPLGQLAGRLMARTGRLQGYGWNLLGSIGGVALLSLLSMAWTPPSVWFLFVVLMVVPFLRGGHLAPTVVAGLLLVAGLGWIGTSATETDLYSPYQKLTVLQRRGAPPQIQVANVYFQRILDFREPSASPPRPDEIELYGAPDFLETSRQYYDLPYVFVDQPERVLVVGAGSGNDVAAALRHGAESVHAVEIDPVIVALGEALHPEEPYSSSAVHTVVDDARAFLRSTDERFDLIVYGLLDSHTLLSGISSVRLDSFVYTVEGLRQARSRLAPGGVLSLSFAVIEERLGYKIFGMLKEAFDGREPLVFATLYDGGMAFLVGEDLTEERLPERLRHQVVDDLAARAAAADVDLSTDDWPFFYMPERRYPVSYVLVVGALLAISYALVRRLVPGEHRASWPCFFLGAGFMLIETKGITELALVYGSTWTVVGLVIVAILILAYLANWLVLRRGVPNRRTSYGLLVASVAAGLVLVSLDLDAVPLQELRLLLTIGLTLPLFFSGLAFSAELARAGSLQSALSANLLGAMLGGFLEYNAMYFGYRILYLVAISMYAAAWIASRRAAAGGS